MMNYDLLILVFMVILICIHFFTSGFISKNLNLIFSVLLTLGLVMYSLHIIRINVLTGESSSDIPVYYSSYLGYTNVPFRELISSLDVQGDWGFRILNWILANLTHLSIVSYAELIFLILLGIVILDGILFFDVKFIDYFVLIFIIFPESSSLLTNIYKQGFAVLIILFAFGIFLNGASRLRLIISIMFMGIAVTFHESAIYILVSFLILGIFHRVRVRWYVFFTLIMILISLTGINKSLFGEYGNYFNNNFSDYTSGIVTYSLESQYLFIAITIFYGFVLGFLYKSKLIPKKLDYVIAYTFWIKQYLMASWLFFAFSYIAFSDRLGKYAWVFFIVAYIYLINKAKVTDTTKHFYFLGLVIFILVLSTLMNTGSYFINKS